ncbi:hypothetical protein CK203_099840 [Vitis vinifera]|uniref:Disease resistance protein n=1 Tax=Vitis vinifera TaxID=29760 RepID=A0A438DZH1_VITVI|nr:hypothetical protein CK203_099840 [Vitis vinifera]
MVQVLDFFQKAISLIQLQGFLSTVFLATTLIDLSIKRLSNLESLATSLGLQNFISVQLVEIEECPVLVPIAK